MRIHSQEIASSAYQTKWKISNTFVSLDKIEETDDYDFNLFLQLSILEMLSENTGTTTKFSKDPKWKYREVLRLSEDWQTQG